MRAPWCQVRVTRADRLPPAADRAKFVDTLTYPAARDPGEPGCEPGFVELGRVRQRPIEPCRRSTSAAAWPSPCSASRVAYCAPAQGRELKAVT